MDVASEIVENENSCCADLGGGGTGSIQVDVQLEGVGRQ